MRAKTVNFERGQDPKTSLNIGDAAIYKKIGEMMKADGWTPNDPHESDSAIAWAVEYNHHQLAKFLLDRHSVDPDAKRGMPDFIQWAAQNKDLAMVELLLSYEPDPSKLNFALRMSTSYEPAYNAIKNYVGKEVVDGYFIDPIKN